MPAAGKVAARMAAVGMAVAGKVAACMVA